MVRTILALTFLGFLSLQSFALQIRGTVVDDQGEPLSYASVYLLNTTHGVSTNLKGEFVLELDSGKYTLVIESFGFQTLEREIHLIQNLQINLELLREDVIIGDVEITADGEDPAYAIIRGAVANRHKFRDPVDAYSYSVYLKANLDKEPINAPDSSQIAERDEALEKAREKHNKKVERNADRKSFWKVEHGEFDESPSPYEKRKMNLIEVYSKVFRQKPGRVKEVVLGFKDLSEKVQQNVRVEVGSGGRARSQSRVLSNPYLYYQGPNDSEFNFYKNNLYIPRLGSLPFTSPISGNCFLSYRYKFVESFFENGVEINKIQVIPKLDAGALFSGHIFIVSESFAIKAVDLTINPLAINLFKRFQVVQQNEQVNGKWMTVRQEYFYDTREGNQRVIGNSLQVFDSFEFVETFPKGTFGRELRFTQDSAYEKGTTFWTKIRPITLRSEELDFIQYQDSIDRVYNSREAIEKRDSIYNRLNYLDLLLFGPGFRNTFKKFEFGFTPLVFSVSPFGVGGPRIQQAFFAKKGIKRGYVWDVFGTINYGIKNADLKGYLGVGFRYLPKRFGRIAFSGGEDYTMLNSFASIANVFSRGNFVKNRFGEVQHSIEVSNGLVLKARANLSRFYPIDSLKLDWDLFEALNEINAPAYFDPFSNFTLEFNAEFTPFQKYYMEPYTKVLAGSDYPTFFAKYKTSIPGVFGSVSNSDYVELGIKHRWRLGKLGGSEMRASSGRFLNTADIRIADIKYFRGSDSWWFSDPLQSLQNLGFTLSTTNTWAQANFVHHFNGFIMNKLPLLNKTKLKALGGLAGFWMTDGDQVHLEGFVGLEHPFRIREQLFRIGTFWVVSDSNLEPSIGRFKVGINFFNAFEGTWAY